MQPTVIVWDLETVPDLAGFAAAHDLVGLYRSVDHYGKSKSVTDDRLKRSWICKRAGLRLIREKMVIFLAAMYGS
jgi:hypothetical protein